MLLLGQPKARSQPNKGCKLRKIWTFRAILFSVLVLIDLISIPYGLSLKEPVTDQVYVTDFYGIPQDMKYNVPEDVQTVENGLLNSFRMKYPRDIISSRSFLTAYEYRNDNTTAGYTWKFIPIYAIFIYRTYAILSPSSGAALTWTVILDILIVSMIVVPIGFLKETFRTYEKIPADFSEDTYDGYERKQVPFIPGNGSISIMWAKRRAEETEWYDSTE